jgi:ABC-type multidrug transport system permease subunit
MYHISPFTYLLEGFLGAVTHNVLVECDENEYARFTPPAGQSCQQYTRFHIQQFGGYLSSDESGGLCRLCQYRNGDEYVSALAPSSICMLVARRATNSSSSLD